MKHSVIRPPALAEKAAWFAGLLDAAMTMQAAAEDLRAVLKCGTPEMRDIASMYISDALKERREGRR